MRRIVELIATIRIEFDESATAQQMLELREKIAAAVQPIIFSQESRDHRRSTGHDYDLHFRDIHEG